MCYINNALDVISKCRTKVRENNLYLNRYYGKYFEQAIVKKFLSIPSFLNNEIAKQLSKVNLQRLICVKQLTLLIPFL